LVKQGDEGNTAALSRDHTVLVSESGLITIAGGKWTTYRRMAEDAIDHAETIAGFDKRECRTHHLPIHGNTDERVDGPPLIHLFGSDAKSILELTRNRPDWMEPLHSRLPYCKAEVIWAAREEMARTVEDILARRTRSLLLDAQAAIEAAPLVGRLLAEELGCDETWSRESAEAFVKLAQGYRVQGVSS